MAPKYLTAGDAARVLKVTPAAVRAMESRGDLKASAETESGIRLFKRSVVERLAKQRARARSGR